MRMVRSCVPAVDERASERVVSLNSFIKLSRRAAAVCVSSRLHIEAHRAYFAAKVS